MDAAQTRLSRWRTTAYAVWAVIGGLLLLVAAGWLLGRVSPALAPFVLAFLLVFLLQGPVRYFERRGVARVWSVAAAFAAGFLALSLVVVFLVPPIARQFAAFAVDAPNYFRQIQDFVTEAQRQFSDFVVPDWIREVAVQVAQALSSVLVRLGNAVAQGILSAGGGLATLLLDVFLGTIIAFWTLKDLPTMREELRRLVGDKYEDDLENLLATVTHVVGGYLKGTTIASLITGALVGIGLAILGVPYALVLAVVTAILNYIPYIGPFVAGVIAAAVGLLVSPITSLIAIAIVIGAQVLVDNLVTPRVMSDQVDLHPTLVIFSLLVGGTLFGFFGMVFAIPVAATAKGLFVYYYERRTQRQLATEDGALFRSASCDDDEAGCEDRTDSAQRDSAPSGDGDERGVRT